MAVSGINGYLVLVQVDISNGLPYYEIVGLPDIIVKESKERVRVAIKNSGYDFFSKRIIINLAPANTKKNGSIFDLPIAIGILNALQIINTTKAKDYVIIGELSLDGKIRRVDGALAICIEMQKLGIKNIILPKGNEKEVCLIDGINIYAVSTLREVVDYLNNFKNIKKSSVMVYDNLIKENIYDIDFSDVCGQENVKRALEISAAGGHNCLITGSPGSGKTMLAQRVPTILPDLTFEEALEVTKIHSLYGQIDKTVGICTKRPYRAPHYSISERALIGGGDIPRARRNYSSKLWGAILR